MQTVFYNGAEYQIRQSGLVYRVERNGNVFRGVKVPDATAQAVCKLGV